MFDNYSSTVLERFLKYAAIDTQSDPHSDTYPSTEKQKNLGRVLVEELKEIGLEEIEMDEHGIIYATLPSNTEKEVPVLCFCSHMDTSPDSSGKDVKPLIHNNYQGQALVLPDDESQVIDPKDHPHLLDKIGEDIITASGTTLLGADNKAGLAAIMDAMNFLKQNPQIKHGKVRILFTCDEEIGRGPDKVDMQKLGADYGYTIDGEEAGSLENETFSADMAVVTFHGISAHPGFAKGKMVNALKVAGHFIEDLPRAVLCPENTEGREGFVHPVEIHGNVEKTTVTFILRDFEADKLQDQAAMLNALAVEATHEFPGASFEIKVTEQYRNMKEILVKHPQVSEYAAEAIKRTGLEVKQGNIRGGTDGSRFTFMGMPCPNVFAGEHAFHSKHEWVSIQDMEKSAQTVVHICCVFEEKA